MLAVRRLFAAEPRSAAAEHVRAFAHAGDAIGQAAHAAGAAGGGEERHHQRAAVQGFQRLGLTGQVEFGVPLHADHEGVTGAADRPGTRSIGLRASITRPRPSSSTHWWWMLVTRWGS